MAPLERPRATRILSRHVETERHATLSFNDEHLAAAAPGTFLMVWVPGVDEVPMAVGYNDSEGRPTMTVEGKGDCTRALLDLGLGDRIGVRGPYGRGFTFPDAPSHLVFVGGGTGIAPMARGARAAFEQGHQVTVIAGARNRSLLLLHDYFEAEAAAGRLRYLPCTDDGSHGFDGYTTVCLQELIGAGGIDYVAACGPEPMMVKVTDMCQSAGVASEASLERYMKCAFGICDACTVGDGLRVCIEGPVFGADELADIAEYGAGHRDACGILHPL